MLLWNQHVHTLNPKPLPCCWKLVLGVGSAMKGKALIFLLFVGLQGEGTHMERAFSLNTRSTSACILEFADSKIMRT